MFEIKRVALYARFSSDNQRTESIDAQIRAMKQFCNQNKWKIVETYIDEAYSATTDKRPSFQRMIGDSEKRIFDIVLVHKLDRFSRNRYNSLIYKNKLKHNGVRLYSVLERIDETPESIILEAMLESISEYYSSNIAREVMKGLKENAFQCKYTGGQVPLGYDIDENKKLVINPHEAEAVKIIFNMYIDGFGYRDIANFLNSNGYRTKNGKTFGDVSNTYASILENEKYMGTYVYNRTAAKDFNQKRNSHRNKPDEEIIRIPNGCPAIVTKEVFENAAEVRKNRKHGRRYKSGSNLCAGIIFCGECGKKMNGSIRRNRVVFNTYTCLTSKNDCCNYKEIDREKINSFCLDLLGKKLFCEKSLRNCIKELNKKIEKYNRELPMKYNQLTEQLNKIKMKIVANNCIDDMTIDICEQQNILEIEKNKIENMINNLHEIQFVSYDDYSWVIEKFASLQNDDVRLKTFVQSYIKRVTVYKDRVIFLIDYGLGLLDEVTKEFSFARTIFKTPTQRLKF